MIRDPFAVLQVSPNASDAELKQAYRKLSKEWHPDQHPENAEAAEEKFKEIQEAYRQIVDARSRGTDPYGAQAQRADYTSYTDTRDYAPYENAYDTFDQFFRQWEQYSRQMRGRQAQSRTQGDSADARAAKIAAETYLGRGHYYDAMQSLSAVAPDARDAEWYYFAALAHRGMGNNVTALQFAKVAADMAPDNGVYAALLRQMQAAGTRYQRTSVDFGGMQGVAPNSFCTTLCIANLMLNFCCRM